MQASIFRGVVLAGLAALALSACATPQSGNVVNAGSAQTAQSVSFGTITGSQPVVVQGGNNVAVATATIAGGILGGVLGNEVGRGTGRTLATGAGATAGAVAGNAVANSATNQQSTEWFVRLDSGASISVIQATPTFSVGQRVQVVQSGSTTRLVP